MNILENEIQDILQDEFIQYSSEILLNNLPSIDGCLPVHRKILLSMLRNGRMSSKPYTKSVKVQGEVVTYYVYGDGPLYQSMTNMANNGMNIPLLDGKGSWGDKLRKNGFPAASRYTECRMTTYAEDMLQGLNKNCVPMKPNFDNTTDEMIIMPSLCPNILLNTSQSISISEASKMPSHNVVDTCHSIINYIKTNNIDDSIEILKCPDFSVGGKIIYSPGIFEKIYKTGKGSFTLIGKYRYVESENKIEIFEIPYETTIESIEEKIRECYNKGLMKEVVDVRNATGLQGIQLDIYLKKNTDIQQFEHKLRKYTSFECKFSCNFTLLDLDFKTPKLMNLKDIYSKWIEHRINCINNETQYDISKKQDKLHLLRGLEKILLDIDKAISIIRNTEKEDQVISNLMSYFKIDEIQSNYVAEIKLRNINKEYIINRTKETENLEKELKELKNFFKNEQLIKNRIIEQLQYVSKTYAKSRKTEIVSEDDAIQTIPQKIIEDYNCTVILTEHAYIKKVQRDGEQKLKDGDSIINKLKCNNRDMILLFSNKGNCYRLPVDDLEDSIPSKIGIYLPNLIGIDKDEQLLSMIIVDDFNGWILVSYENGNIAKIELKSFETKTNRSKLANSLNLDNKLINIFVLKKDIDIFCRSSIDKGLVISTSYINPKQSRNTQGVKIMKSKKDSKMVACVPLLDVQGIEDIEYFRVNGAAVGCFIQKGTQVELKI